jgi:uncharacterized membrane protein (GlpM family)
MNFSGLAKQAVKLSASNRATALFFIFCLLVTVWVRKSGYDGYQFGQEIGNVSAALASGEGFSHVFDNDSGPTAWTPVFYTAIYALIFIIFGVKTVYAYWALFTLRCILLASTFHLALKTSYSSKLDRYKFLMLPIFLVYAYYVVMKRGMDDVIFNVWLSMVMIYAISRFLDHGFSKVKWLFYILALIVPLSNISLFLGLLLLVLLTQIFKQLPEIPTAHAVGLVVVMFLAATGWGLRNQRVLGQFIPFKSNLWFELHLSNVLDQDGILRFTNFREYHPLSNTQINQQYKALGETKFLDQYKSASLDYLANNQLDFVKKILNRAHSVFIWTQFDINNVELASEQIQEDDIGSLESAGLLLNGEWICVDMTPRQFEREIQQLNLSDAGLVELDWRAKKSRNKKAKLKMNNLIRGFLMSLLPTVALIIGLLVRPVRNSKTFQVTLVLFLLTIGPYMLISIHTRYQLFQMSYFVIFVFLAAAYLTDRYLVKLVDIK